MLSNNTMEYRINLEKLNKRNDQVTELILDNCRASQISGLTDEFVNLETLSLINVGLVTLKGFPKLPKLKKLELSDNRITCGLSLLHGSPKLQHLNLSGNRIKDFEALEPLKEFHDLVNLDLYNCEVTKCDDYRQKVFNLLPNLHSLDGYDRNEREVADSDESEDEGSDVENRITREDNDLEDESSDVENRITREDNDLDDEEDEEEGESSEYDEEDMNGVDMNYNEEDDDEDDDDDIDEEGEDDESSEEEDDEGEESEVHEITASSDHNQNTTNQLSEGDDSVGKVENGEGDGDDDDDGDEDVDDEEVDGSDLKQLQRDIDEEDSDDDDFEPTHEPDERDYEIDPEDDADEEDSEAQLSSSKLDATVSSEESRGQKRKREDEGGDEVGEE